MRGVIHGLGIVIPSVQKAGALPNSTIAVQAQDAIRRALAVQMWAWFDEHRDDVVYTVKVWVFSKAIRIGDLKVVFERLFGSRPL